MTHEEAIAYYRTKLAGITLSEGNVPPWALLLEAYEEAEGRVTSRQEAFYSALDSYPDTSNDLEEAYKALAAVWEVASSDWSAEQLKAHHKDALDKAWAFVQKQGKETL